MTIIIWFGVFLQLVIFIFQWRLWRCARKIRKEADSLLGKAHTIIDPLIVENRALRTALHDVHVAYNAMRYQRNRFCEAWKNNCKELPPELLDCLKIEGKK